MPEYIEKEAALASVCEDCSAQSDCKKGERCVDYERVKSIPAADVAPVRHGRWIWDEENWWHKCSACGMMFDYDKTYELFDHGYQLANYCPYCGAKLDANEP